MNLRIVTLVHILIFSLFCQTTNGQSKVGDYHFHKGDTFLLKNRHDSSIFHFEKARSIYLQEQHWRGVVSSDNKIAENLSDIFELKRAMKLAKQAYEMAHDKLGEWDIERATALNNIGNIHYLTGRHELALEEYEKALFIANHEVHAEVLFSAPTSLGIGNVYFGKHQYEEAFVHFQTALETNKRMLGEEHPYVANSYLSLGNLYRNKGSYNLAKENYNKALEININHFGEDHPDVATTYVGIADIHKSSGSYDLALQYYRQALITYQTFLHEKNPKFGAIYLGFGDVYKNRGNFKKAEEYYQKALDLFELTIGLEHQSSVRSYLGLANTFMYQERFREALDYYNIVMDINFNLVGENHVNSSAANNNLGSIYYFFGDYELAIRYFAKALKIDKNIHGDEHPNVANASYNLARVYGERGQIAQALDYCQDAINSSIVDFKSDNIFVNPSLVNFFDTKDLLWYLRFKGELLEEGFKNAKNVKGLDVSLNSFVLSDSLIDQIRKSYTDRRDQIQLSKLSGKIYESSVNVSYGLINLINAENVKYIDPDISYETKKKEYENRYFFFTEKDKGAILFSSLAESNAKSFGGIPDSLLAKELDLKTRINNYTQELAANPNPDMLEIYQRELFIANRDYEKLLIQFEEDFPRYYDLKYDVSVANLDEIKSFLDDSTMMLSYFLTDDSVYMTQIDRKEMCIEKVFRNPKYDKAVKAFRNGILYQIDKPFLEYGHMLYNQLIPSEIPDHIKNIIVVQDGLMAVVPFEAMLTKEVLYSDTLDYSAMPYLLHDYNISYTYSANLLYKTFNNKHLVRPKAKKDGIIMAPVEFNHIENALKLAKEKSYEEANQALNLRKNISITGQNVKPLKGSLEEIKIMDTLFSKYNKQVDNFIYYDAQEDLAKNKQLGQYKYVHVASHGFVNQSEPEFSGIFLSRDTVANKEDGILFAGEIYNIDLNAELISLSACETGLGKLSSGEGIIGLTRSLIYAGAKNITVSLWKVSDAETKDLMTHYYNNFLGEKIPTKVNESLSYAEALKKAKQEMIKKGGKSAHPYYWSSFVLMGK